MKYALLIYDQQQYWNTWSEDERSQILAEYQAFTDRVKSKGIFCAAEPLQPIAEARTLRRQDSGELLETDGPFAETREQLAGFYLLECENLDEAIELAAEIPAARFGTIEVRPAIELEVSQ